jgi:4-diphosphocytidyl-2-C-methyl-D-erythritol kinase
MIIFPQAKINLGLQVLNKRSDGYHEVETCMFSIPLFDILEILPAEEFSFKQSGLHVDSEPSSNLCVKAYELVKKTYDCPAIYMHLRKQIPMGAGLGGGSSDAAHVINGLNDLFELNIPIQEREHLAAQLGSDCPFFIEGTPKIATGRGEILNHSTVDLSGYHLKLIYPAIHVGTAEAYAGVEFYTGKENLSKILALPMEDWQGAVVNSFENSIFKKHPVMEEIKDLLIQEGAVFAAMSGSGSTLFGIYETLPTPSDFPESYQQFCLSL